MIPVPIRIHNTASQVTNIRPKLPVNDNNFSPDPKLWGNPKLFKKKYALYIYVRCKQRGYKRRLESLNFEIGDVLKRGMKSRREKWMALHIWTN